jgi:ABC-type branched-subunit amino acid transport system substrate-binding protein
MPIRRRNAYQIGFALILLGGFLSASLQANAGQNGQLAQGVTDNTILVGHLGPQTGPAATYDGTRKGIKAYFNYVNEHGGVNGRKVKLIAYDDQYKPSKAVRLAHRLVEQDHVFAMVANVGTPPNQAVFKYLKKAGIPMIMTCTGSDQFYEPPVANYFGACVPSYSFEARLMVRYAVKNLGAKKLAIAYQNDDYGTPINEAGTKAMKNYPDAKIVARVNFQVGNSDFSAQAQKLRNAKPDAILVFSTPAPAAHLEKALYNIGINSDNTDLVVTEEAGNYEAVFDLAGKNVWNGTYSLAAEPSPYDTDNKQIQIYDQQMKKDFPDTELTGAPQLGWGPAQVFVEALKRTKKLTWENFLNSFKSFDNWKGSMYAGITFSKDNHYGVTTAFMTQAKDGKIVPISGLINLDPATGKFTEKGEVDQ